MTLHVEIARCGVRTPKVRDSLAGEMSGGAAIGARGFGGFDLGHVAQVARHLLNVDSSVLVATRSNRSPASEVSTLGFDNHRVLGADLFDLAPRDVDAREGIFDSDSRIGEVDFRSLKQEVNGEGCGCAGCRDLKGIVVGVDEQGVGEERYEDVAEDRAVERAIWSELCGICAIVEQFAECGVAHE